MLIRPKRDVVLSVPPQIWVKRSSPGVSLAYLNDHLKPTGLGGRFHREWGLNVAGDISLWLDLIYFFGT
jgi:hypothetical protein